LAGSLATEPETRTCTVPANTPILFSPFNYLCSELFPEDQPPYDTCAKKNTQAVIDSPSSFYARVDGKDANQQRIASGLFQWTRFRLITSLVQMYLQARMRQRKMGSGCFWARD
jgi:hypothetical protein